MAKKILNSTINESSENLPEKKQQEIKTLSKQFIFEPTKAQAKLKAKFWTRFQPGPMQSSDNITLSVAMDVTSNTSLEKYWREPGFRDWFLNNQEERERLRYLFNKSLDAVENILDNPEANANAKANLVKLLAEMTGHLSKKPVEKFSDESINRMSEHELKTFLSKKGVRLVEEKVIDVSRREETDQSGSDKEKA